MNKEKIVGILGGMGPAATIDLMARILRHTPTVNEQEHIRCVVDNNPKIPSRIAAILEGSGKSPAPELVSMAQGLERWGVNFLAIPCNTAHYYYTKIANAVKIPVLNMIDLTVDEFVRRFPDTPKVGVLGSTAVVKTGLYARKFQKFGVMVVDLPPDIQEQLLGLIKAVKAGVDDSPIRSAFYKICEHIRNAGAEVAIIGCTELSVINGNLPVSTIDAAEILAREIVATAKHRTAPMT
ncbi:MAG: aspartate/glutamate racemase family protein [Desulfobacteraceae bacterium]|nr:aspartate/glutamate racemase family protein [Desulfobacteraceae bacterium]